MSVSVLICTIIFYILSLVGALLLSMSVKKISSIRIRQLIRLHFSALLLTILFYFLLREETIYHSFFLLTCCTGIASSGLVMRSAGIKPLIKTYFGAYLLSILLFLYSPSLLFYFISGNIQQYSPNQEIKLKENCYLVRQQSMLTTPEEIPHYKVIEKYGIYNKTLVRNLNFTQKIDSVHILAFTSDTVILRGFFAGHDSTDRGFRPGRRENTLTTRPKNNLN